MSNTSDSQDQEPAAQEAFSVQRIANLAKLDADKSDHLQDQLERILGFVAVLDELNLDDIEPFFGATNLRENEDGDDAPQPIRKDEPIDSLPRDQALQNSPSDDDEFYLVPPVFD